LARDTRSRMVFSAAELFRQHGYNGTGFRDVVAHSGASRGSIYHHFPGGKAELGMSAVALAAEFIDAGIAQGLQADDLVAGFESFWGWWTEYVEASHFQAGCPGVAVAVESHVEAPELAVAAAEAFGRWQSTVASALRNAGVADPEAKDMAALIISGVEGATVLCRAAGNREPLARAGRQLARVLRELLSRVPPLTP
jgi:AcrR family transcriptional regulator